MAVSVTILAIIVSLHLIALVLAIGAERRRSTVTICLSLPLCVGVCVVRANGVSLCRRRWYLMSTTIGRIACMAPTRRRCTG
jgi:hypothetical protein